MDDDGLWDESVAFMCRPTFTPDSYRMRIITYTVAITLTGRMKRTEVKQSVMNPTAK